VDKEVAVDDEEWWEDEEEAWEEEEQPAEEWQEEEKWEEEDEGAQQQTARGGHSASSSSWGGERRGTKRPWKETQQKQGRWSQEEWEEWEGSPQGKAAHKKTMPKPWVKRRASEEETQEEEDEEAEDAKQWWGRAGKGKGKGKKGDKDKGKGKGKGKGKKGRKMYKRDGPHPSEEEMPDKFGDTWEEPRDSTGLKLLGELAPRSARWKYILSDESRRSFAGYLANPFQQHLTDKWEAAVREGTEWQQHMGKHGPVPRKTAWMVKKGCTCAYRYGGLEVQPQIYPNWMLELLRHAMPLCGLADTKDWPDSCNMNLYSDGSMSVGWHSDDERLFQGSFQDIRIISLSFGQARRFELRANWVEGKEKRLNSISLGTGDLMTMEGMVQKHFQHRVPREEDVDGARINLTWRWIEKHNPRCPAGRRRH